MYVIDVINVCAHKYEYKEEEKKKLVLLKQSIFITCVDASIVVDVSGRKRLKNVKPKKKSSQDKLQAESKAF